jgi:Flp pilus assembly protein TadG
MKSRRRPQWDRSERGSAAELALVCVPLMLLVFLVVAGGRVASARSEVDAAARDAARAASTARTPGAANRAAQDAAAASLATDGLACRSFSVSVDLSNFTPGGTVSAHVECSISLAELTLLRLPASTTITSQFVEPVDTYLGAP